MLYGSVAFLRGLMDWRGMMVLCVFVCVGACVEEKLFALNNVDRVVVCSSLFVVLLLRVRMRGK